MCPRQLKVPLTQVQSSHYAALLSWSFLIAAEDLPVPCHVEVRWYDCERRKKRMRMIIPPPGLVSLERYAHSILDD